MKTYTQFSLYLSQFFLECEMFQTKFVEELKHTLYFQWFFFLENRVICEIMWKNRLRGHRWQYDACALHAGYLRLQTQTLILANYHWFSTATMITRTHLNVTFYVHCLSLFVHVLFFPYVLFAPFDNRNFMKTTSCDSSFFVTFLSPYWLRLG